MVIVIGATGFIGLYTVEKLMNEGYEVLGTGRNQNTGDFLTQLGAKFITLDITEPNNFNRLPTQNVEAVILLAGLLPANAKIDIDVSENADDYVKTNILGTINVLEYCRKNHIRKLLCTSSYADVRQAWKKDIFLTENEPRNFLYTGDHAAYVISKNAASDYCEYYNQQHEMQCVVFRLPPVYGVGPHSEIFVNGRYYKTGFQTFIENAERGDTIEIWGDPHISRDIVYVKDVAHAFIQAIRSNKAYGLYNITSGVPLELEEQINVIIEVYTKDKSSKIVYRPEKKNNTPSFLFSIDKASRDFGYAPQFTSFRKLLMDYKQEYESGRWEAILQCRKKIKEAPQ